MAVTLSRIPSVRCEDDLVAAARAGDDRAFEELYSRYSGRIVSFVDHRVHDHGRAEDISQDVFMSALRRLRASQQPITFKPWIYEIAKNACIDEYRRGTRSRELPVETDPELAAGGTTLSLVPTPPSAVESKQTLADLRGAFGGLSDSHHQLLVMRELEGLSYDEIGQRLGMTRQMVESSLFRARRKLTEEYEEIASGRRCQQVQAAIDAGELQSSRSLGIRQRRRFARHLAHCQACRHVARLAGVDDALVKPRSVGAKIAALLPLPLLRRLWSTLRGRGGAGGGGAGGGGAGGGGGVARAGGGSSAAGHAPLTTAAATAPAAAPAAGLVPAAAAVAAVALAGAGFGVLHATDSGHPATARAVTAAPAAGHGARTSGSSARAGTDRSAARHSAVAHRTKRAPAQRPAHASGGAGHHSVGAAGSAPARGAGSAGAPAAGAVGQPGPAGRSAPAAPGTVRNLSGGSLTRAAGTPSLAGVVGGTGVPGVTGATGVAGGAVAGVAGGAAGVAGGAAGVAGGAVSTVTSTANSAVTTTSTVVSKAAGGVAAGVGGAVQSVTSGLGGAVQSTKSAVQPPAVPVLGGGSTASGATATLPSAGGATATFPSAGGATATPPPPIKQAPAPKSRLTHAAASATAPLGSAISKVGTSLLGH